MNIILVSSSEYRKILLKKMNIPFSIKHPTYEEGFEQIKELKRLSLYRARNKVHSVIPKKTDGGTYVWIGSDQIVEIEGRELKKPKNQKEAENQLQFASQKQANIWTSLYIYRADRKKHTRYSYIDRTKVYYKKLHKIDILNYIKLDKPYDCAGSLKFEEHGWMFIKKIQTQDPFSLMGLPLLSLYQFMEKNYPTLCRTSLLGLRK